LRKKEGLSYREEVSALRRDIAWKVACGLRLDDEGFHPTVLAYWRNRIRRSQRPKRIFEAVGQVVQASGVLAGRRRRVLDSTILEDAVATQDTVIQLVAAIRRVRRLLPAAATVKVGAHDYERAGKPACDWEDPAAMQALVTGLVDDALAVLAAVQDAQVGAEQAEAVALLALVAGQDVEAGERSGTRRDAGSVSHVRPKRLDYRQAGNPSHVRPAAVLFAVSPAHPTRRKPGRLVVRGPRCMCSRATTTGQAFAVSGRLARSRAGVSIQSKGWRWRPLGGCIACTVNGCDARPKSSLACSSTTSCGRASGLTNIGKAIQSAAGTMRGPAGA
jgi:hypothetical protein